MVVKWLFKSMISIVLAVMILLYPHKVAGIVVAVLAALWDIAVTIGRGLRVPGTEEAVISPLGLMVWGSLTTPRQSRIPGGISTMLNKIRTLPLRGFVSAQTAVLSAADSASESKAMQTQALGTRRGRIEMAIGALMAYVVYAGAVNSAFAKSNTAATQKSADGLLSLINTFTTFLIIVLAAGSLLMGIAAALMFVGSGGSAAAIKRAKDTIRNVVIGLVVAAGIFIIKKAIIETVGAPGVDGSGGKKLRDIVNKNGDGSGF